MTEPIHTDINVPFPDAADLHLRIAVGACRLKVRPGADDAWVKGTYDDPSGKLGCNIIQEGGNLRITHGQNITDFLGVFAGVPVFDLMLGAARPYMLTFEVGASENLLDLSGLPLTRLVLHTGAGKTELTFAQPNPQTMSLLECGVGAASFEAKGLGFANFTEMKLEGGAAGYNIDFSGPLRQNAHVRVSTGVAGVELAIPATTAAKVTSESPLGSLEADKNYTRHNGSLWTPAAEDGKTPTLLVNASVTLGALRLRLV